MKQKDLASMAYATDDSICCWEKGRRLPNVHSAYLLAKALNIGVGWLVTGKEEADGGL